LKDIFSDETLDRLDGAIEQSMSARTFVVGDMIGGRFKVERVVGRGNFGFVYRALDTQSGKKRAIKTFYERLTSRPGAAVALRALGDRLRDVVHPNLVRVFETGVDGNLVYFVEEFVSALTLDKLVEAVRKHAPEKGFPEEQMSEVVHQVCAGLEQLGDLPHMGLTPQNIFMSKAGVKLSDIGVASWLREVMTADDFQVMSGRTFLAPEFVRDGVRNGSADVYSLGKLLEYLLTLEVPAAGRVGGPIKGEHAAGLLDLVHSACDDDPDQRLPNPGVFLGSYEAARAARAAAPALGKEEFVRPEEAAADRLAEAAELALSAVSEAVTSDHREREALEEVAAVVERETVERVEEPAAVELPDERFTVEEEFFGEALSQGEAAREAPGALPAIEEELPPIGEYEAPARPAEMPPVLTAKAPVKSRAWLGWLAAAVVAALVVVGVLYKDRLSPPPAEPTPPVDQNTFDLEGITYSPEPGGPTYDEMMEALLLQANTYVNQNRITDPPEESAYGLYSFILDIDPKNAKAQEGLAAIENRYLTLGRAFMNSKNYPRAQWAFRKVLVVNKQSEEAARELTKLASLVKTPPEATPLPGEKPGPTPTPTPGGPQPTPEVATTGPLPQLTADHIRRTIANSMGRVKFCFAKNPDASGVVKVKFVIAPAGNVASAAITSSTLGNAEIEQCLVRRVMLMRFPAFEGSSKTVTFPFNISK